MRTRVKFCGITSEADLDAAVSAGADALGFNLYAGSARYIDVDACRELLEKLPPLVTSVGLVVNPSAEEMREFATLPLDLFQFHGDETEDFCQAYGRPYIKAIRVASAVDIDEHAYNFPSARGLLLDAKVEGQWGGTGQKFDWRLARGLPQPVILAGGMTTDTVGDAIRVARPWAVDVSSGIEREIGRKDPAKMAAFAAAVKAADGEIDE